MRAQIIAVAIEHVVALLAVAASKIFSPTSDTVENVSAVEQDGGAAAASRCSVCAHRCGLCLQELARIDYEKEKARRSVVAKK